MQTFADLYLAHCGTTEVPEAYHRWTCLSLLAAFAEDRVFGMKHAAQKLTPNVYVLLVGGGGIGRSQAIRTALALAEPLLPRLNVCHGRLTAKMLVESMGVKPRSARRKAPDSIEYETPKHILIDAGKPYVVCDDLGLSIGRRYSGKEFVELMTGLYDGAAMPVEDSYGTFSMVKIRASAVNWLAGASRDWIVRHVTPEAIHAGFFGQTVIVEAAYKDSERIAEPSYPEDYDAIVTELRWRLGRILAIKSARVPLAEDAREWMRKWYGGRAQPVSRMLAPVWRRQQDLVYKVGILLALSEWTGRAREWAAESSRVPPIVVRGWHLGEAVGLLAAVQEGVDEYVRAALVMPPEPVVRCIADELKKLGGAALATLHQAGWRKRFTRAQVAEALVHLRTEGLILRKSRGEWRSKTWWYEWKGEGSAEVSEVRQAW